MKLVTFVGSHGRERLGAIVGPVGDNQSLTPAPPPPRDPVPKPQLRPCRPLS